MIDRALVPCVCLRPLTAPRVLCAQESDAAHIVTYPREVEGVVRKTDDRRKLARQRKAERKEAAAAERTAEVRRNGMLIHWLVDLLSLQLVALREHAPTSKLPKNAASCLSEMLVAAIPK